MTKEKLVKVLREKIVEAFEQGEQATEKKWVAFYHGRAKAYIDLLAEIQKGRD